MNKIGLEHILKHINNKRIFLRADYNVPLSDGIISDTTRITSTLPTIETILSNNPKGLIIASHMGRPNDQINQKFSLYPVAEELQKLTNLKVRFVEDCVGEEALELSNSISNGEILLLENLRFHSEEEGKVKVDGKSEKVDPAKIQAFRDRLTQMTDIYVNDAFGTLHRAHSSIVGVNVPIRAAGLLVQKELTYFGNALSNPKRPFVVVLGGAKVADKLPLLHNLLHIADEIVIGGGMAFTFLKVLYNTEIGDSLFDPKSAENVKELIQKANDRGVKFHLPIDFVCGKEITQTDGLETRDLEMGVPKGQKGFDIGEASVKRFSEVMSRAGTIVMNGPMGAFEYDSFASGSLELIKSINKQTREGGISILGGGDTVNLVNHIPGASKEISHISTGGGASLELLQGKTLPGINNLTDLSFLS